MTPWAPDEDTPLGSYVAYILGWIGFDALAILEIMLEL